MNWEFYCLKEWAKSRETIKHQRLIFFLSNQLQINTQNSIIIY